MRYTDLILKDFPIAVYPLDEQITGTSNYPCSSITDTSNSQTMNGEYIYNAGWKAQNTGLPLVLGGEDSTYLLPNASSPSLKIPRLNCFSANSLYTDSTLEFWLKIEKSTTSEIKVMGVDDSGLGSFGLYIYKNYIVFKLDEDSFIAAPVQTWNTQHHIAIVYSYSGISLIVDGTKYDPFIKKSTQIGFQNNKNFVFYGSDSLGKVWIDAIALYKYGLTEQNIKRHMVYALGFNFAGTPFFRNSGTFATFENINSKKVDDFLIPLNDSSINFENENLILSKNGIQLFNSDKITYVKNHSQLQNFYFTNSSYIKIENLSSYTDDNYGIAVSFRITSAAPQDEEQTLFFMDGSQNTGDIQVVYLNGNLYLRVYSIDKIVSDPKYHEKNIGSVSLNTDYLFGLSLFGNEYNVFLNDTKISYADIPTVIFDDQSCLFVGATALLSDTQELELFFEDGYIERITIFKSTDEFSSIINTTAGNLSRFNNYYKNFTITFNNRIRLHRKGSMGLDFAMDQFGKPIWDGTESKSSTGGVKIEHLYPDVEDSEIYITIDQYQDETAINPEYVQVLNNQIDMLVGVSHNNDIYDGWISVDVDFDSDDCLYFPPILGQLSFMSMASDVSDPDSISSSVSLEYSNFENSIQLISQDSTPFLEEYMTSPIALGKNSGINISGLPLEYTYKFSTGSQEGLDDTGIKTFSMFVKRNTADTSKQVFSWSIVSGTLAPTSASLYIDGQFASNIDLTNKTNILWSDLNIDQNVWRHIIIIFNTPIIYKTSTKHSPQLMFGDDSGVSNLSIQHMGVSEIEFTATMIEYLYKLFSGDNRVSAVSSQPISIYESVNGLQLYTNNWQRVT